MNATFWADDYVEKQRSAPEAIHLIKPGQRVFIGSACGEPQHLVRELFYAVRRFADIEIVRLFCQESSPLSLIAEKTQNQLLNIRAFYLGSARSGSVARNKRFIVPINLSDVPHLFKSRKLPIHVALIQVSPPDDFGWLSLGVSVDVTLAATLAADLVVAQVNSRMPRVPGRSFIHVNDVDIIVEHDENLLTGGKLPKSAPADMIARHIERLVEDGSTIQIGMGTTASAVLLALSNKNDLGIHTQHITDDIMHLVSKGVVTNRKKGLNEGKLVASGAIGTHELYEFLDDNPGVEFYPSDYVNDPSIISSHHKMVSINSAIAMDLTGQVAADAIPQNRFSGVTGMLDFMRGAVKSADGKTIIMLPSTIEDGRQSSITPLLNETAVVVPRGDVRHVVTEYGAVNLFGKSLQERAVAMISIAHPDFREKLFEAAKNLDLIDTERVLRKSIRSVYPIHLEETREIDGEIITIRPVKPVDERRIQEHFYNLERADIVSRFFQEKSTFFRKDIEGISQIDYIRDLILVAVVGEFGFGKVVAVGECLLEPKGNRAEVAFSVSSAYQGKGLGRALIRKLAEAAWKNKISGLVSYTASRNKRMIHLFKSLPYQVKTTFDDDMLVLSCHLDEPELDSRKDG